MAIESRGKKIFNRRASELSSFDAHEGPSVNSVEGFESTLDQLQEQQEFLEKDISFEQPQPSVPVVPTAPVPQGHITVTPKSDNLDKIEKILEEDMDYIFDALPQHLQEEFKLKRREAARGIEVLLTKTRVNVKKIIRLIAGWLKIIPGINKFFLEQEAKIKADKILNEFTNHSE